MQNHVLDELNQLKGVQNQLRDLRNQLRDTLVISGTSRMTCRHTSETSTANSV